MGNESSRQQEAQKSPLQTEYRYSAKQSSDVSDLSNVGGDHIVNIVMQYTRLENV